MANRFRGFEERLSQQMNRGVTQQAMVAGRQARTAAQMATRNNKAAYLINQKQNQAKRLREGFDQRLMQEQELFEAIDTQMKSYAAQLRYMLQMFRQARKRRDVLLRRIRQTEQGRRYLRAVNDRLRRREAQVSVRANLLRQVSSNKASTVMNLGRVRPHNR